jgi:hypothetical protein
MCAGADLLAIVDIMAGQFLEGPVIERFTMRFETDEVMSHEVIKPIG